MKATQHLAAAMDGFPGWFYASPTPSDRCMLVFLGDDGNDFMDKAVAKWLTRVHGCNALCVGLRQNVRQQDTGVHDWPLEQVAAAAHWAKQKGFAKLGLFGMSMQACLVLSAACRIPDFSLVIAFAPADFVPWGFVHGKIDGNPNGEWPSGGSTFTWQGQPLPFQPAMQDKEAYWQMFTADGKRFHEMHSRGVFEYSEQQHPIDAESFIPVENIAARLVLVGAEDDSMWDSARYIRRMEARMQKAGRTAPLDVFLYRYGTHLLVPQKLLKSALPVGGCLISRMFASGRKHPGDCKQARLDLEDKLARILADW